MLLPLTALLMLGGELGMILVSALSRFWVSCLSWVNQPFPTLTSVPRAKWGEPEQLPAVASPVPGPRDPCAAEAV